MKKHLYQSKYRIKSSRLSTYDYSSNGWYFVTVCVKDRKCVLGKIEKNAVVLSKIGKIVEREIIQTEEIRKNVMIDTYIIMPNHVHLILVIHNVETSRRDVSTNNLQSNSLGSIIGQIKSVSTKHIRTFYPLFAWQPNYYDHIIRNETSLNFIREYILFNPYKWNIDEENPINSKK